MVKLFKIFRVLLKPCLLFSQLWSWPELMKFYLPIFMCGANFSIKRDSTGSPLKGFTDVLGKTLLCAGGHSRDITERLA